MINLIKGSSSRQKNYYGVMLVHQFQYYVFIENCNFRYGNIVSKLNSQYYIDRAIE